MMLVPRDRFVEAGHEPWTERLLGEVVDYFSRQQEDFQADGSGVNYLLVVYFQYS
jgi:hypothetical protein